MPYLYKRVITKHKEFITRTKCFYYNPENSKKSRRIRLYKTSEKRKERNKRKAYLKRKYEMFNNFDVGDWSVTLTSREIFSGMQFHKNMIEVIGLLRKWCNRRKIKLVYYAKTEAAEEMETTVRAHAHLIIKNTNPAIIGKLIEYWQKYGNVKDTKRIYNIENGKLINYILNGGNHKGLDFEKYSHSRNLIQPEVKTRIYPYDSFRMIPRPPKSEEYGYRYEIRNLYNGFPDRDGYTYQEYELVKVKEDKLE